MNAVQLFCVEFNIFTQFFYLLLCSFCSLISYSINQLFANSHDKSLLRINLYALVIGLPGKGDPGTTGGKSAKIEEECASVPGSFWSSGPFSWPMIGNI